MIFSIADNIQNVRKRIQKATIEAGRTDSAVKLLAVSKTRPAEALLEAMQSGISCFGENYLNEALDKQRELEALCSAAQLSALSWHFIGPIQSNKTKAIAENFDWVHSVDRLKIAKRLNDQRPVHLTPLNICIQVNIDQEETKSGVLLEAVPSLIQALKDLPNLKCRGLMCIPNANLGEVSVQQAFMRMKTSYERLKETGSEIDTLSMGMSGDIETAIKCGSTVVRVGTSLFGAREAKQN